MKPFDLEAAKRGEPITNNYGLERYFIGVEKNGYVVCEDEAGHTIYYHHRDLFMAPKKTTVWVNLYDGGQYNARDTEEDADHTDSLVICTRIGGKAYPVEIEE